MIRLSDRGRIPNPVGSGKVCPIQPTFDQHNRRVSWGVVNTFAASLPDSVVAPVLGAARASAHVDIPVDRYQVANERWEESTGQIAMRSRSLSRIITASRQSKVGPKAAGLPEALRSSNRQRLVLMVWRLCRWHRRR